MYVEATLKKRKLCLEFCIKSWKNPGILWVQRSGNPVFLIFPKSFLLASKHGHLLPSQCLKPCTSLFLLPFCWYCHYKFAIMILQVQNQYWWGKFWCIALWNMTLFEFMLGKAPHTLMYCKYWYYNGFVAEFLVKIPFIKMKRMMIAFYWGFKKSFIQYMFTWPIPWYIYFLTNKNKGYSWNSAVCKSCKSSQSLAYHAHLEKGRVALSYYTRFVRIHMNCSQEKNCSRVMIITKNCENCLRISKKYSRVPWE